MFLGLFTSLNGEHVTVSETDCQSCSPYKFTQGTCNKSHFMDDFSFYGDPPCFPDFLARGCFSEDSYISFNETFSTLSILARC